MLNMDPSSQWTMFNKYCQNYQNTPILQRYTYESQLLKFHPPLLNRLRNKHPTLECRILPRSKNLRNDSQSFALRRGMFLRDKSGSKRYSTDFKHAGTVLNSVANKSPPYPNDQNLETSLAEKTIQKCIVDKTTDLLQLIEFKRNYHNHLKAFNNLIKNVTKWMTIAANCVDLESTNFQRCREMKPKPFPDIACDTISEKCENTSECDINEPHQIDANMRTQFTSTSISMIQNVLNKSNQWIGMCDKETQLFRKRKFSENRKKKRREINESKTESIAMAVSVANCIPMLCKRPLSCKIITENLTLGDVPLNDLPKALDQLSSKSVHRCPSQSNLILLDDPMLVKKENAREISLEIESETGNTQNHNTLTEEKYNQDNVKVNNSLSVDMDDISDKKRKLIDFENNFDNMGSKRSTSLSNIGHSKNKANELEVYNSLKTPQRDSKVEETQNVSSNQNGEENDTSNLQFSLLETVMSSPIALYMKSVIEKIKKNSTEEEPLTPNNKEEQLKPKERHLDKGNNEENISKKVNTKNKLETGVSSSSSLNNRTQLENTPTETEKSFLDEKSNKNVKENRRKVLKEQVNTPKNNPKPKSSLPQSVLNSDTKKKVNTESENKKKCFFLKKTPLNFSKKSDKQDDRQNISATEKKDDQLVIKRVSSPSVSINSRQTSFNLGEKLKDNFSRRRPSTAPASEKSKRQMDKKDDASNKMKTSNTIATANTTKKSDKTTPVIDLGSNFFKKTSTTPTKTILKPKLENKQNQSTKATVKGSTKHLESKEGSKRKPESSSKLITVNKAENTLNLDGGRELKPNTSSVPKKPSKGKSLLKKTVVEKALIAEPFKKNTFEENMVLQPKTVLKEFRDLVVERCSCKFDAEKMIRAALYNSEAKNFTPFQKLLAKEKQKALKVLNTINDTFRRPQKDDKIPQYDHKKKKSSRKYGQHQSYILRRYNKRKKIHKPKSKKYSNHYRNDNPNVDSFVQLNSLLWENTSCSTKQTKSEIQLHVLHTQNVKDNNSDMSVVDSSLSNSIWNKIDNKEHQLLTQSPTIEEFGKSCPHLPKEPDKCNSFIRNVCSDEELSRSTKSLENITLSQALLKIQNFIITSEKNMRSKKEITTETKKFQDDFVPSKASTRSNSVIQEEKERQEELGDNREVNKNFHCIRGVKNTPKDCSIIAIQSEEKFPVNSLRNIVDYNDNFQVSFTSKEVRQFIQHSCNAMKNVALKCGISNTRNVQSNPSKLISLGDVNGITNNIVVSDHHPNKMCCYYFDTCSSFLYEIAHHSRKWSKWVKQIFKGIHTFTSFVKEIKDDDDEKMKTLYQNEWHNFTVMVCKMLNSWQKYSQEIRKVTEYVLLKFKRKGVNCCPKCLEEGRINDVYLMQEVTKKLTDAITTAELWRGWLDDVMSQAFLLIDSCPKLDKDQVGGIDNPNLSYKNMIHTFSQIALYIGEASKTIQKIETTSFGKDNSFAFTK